MKKQKQKNAGKLECTMQKPRVAYVWGPVKKRNRKREREGQWVNEMEEVSETQKQNDQSAKDFEKVAHNRKIFHIPNCHKWADRARALCFTTTNAAKPSYASLLRPSGDEKSKNKTPTVTQQE